MLGHRIKSTGLKELRLDTKGSKTKSNKAEDIVSEGTPKWQERAGFKLAKLILLERKHSLALPREHDFFYFSTTLWHGFGSLC